MPRQAGIMSNHLHHGPDGCSGHVQCSLLGEESCYQSVQLDLGFTLRVDPHGLALTLRMGAYIGAYIGPHLEIQFEQPAAVAVVVIIDNFYEFVL